MEKKKRYKVVEISSYKNEKKEDNKKIINDVFTLGFDALITISAFYIANKASSYTYMTADGGVGVLMGIGIHYGINVISNLKEIIKLIKEKSTADNFDNTDEAIMNELSSEENEESKGIRR